MKNNYFKVPWYKIIIRYLKFVFKKLIIFFLPLYKLIIYFFYFWLNIIFLFNFKFFFNLIYIFLFWFIKRFDVSSLQYRFTVSSNREAFFKNILFKQKRHLNIKRYKQKKIWLMYYDGFRLFLNFWLFKDNNVNIKARMLFYSFGIRSLYFIFFFYILFCFFNFYLATLDDNVLDFLVTYSYHCYVPFYYSSVFFAKIIKLLTFIFIVSYRLYWSLILWIEYLIWQPLWSILFLLIPRITFAPSFILWAIFKSLMFIAHWIAILYLQIYVQFSLFPNLGWDFGTFSLILQLKDLLILWIILPFFNLLFLFYDWFFFFAINYSYIGYFIFGLVIQNFIEFLYYIFEIFCDIFIFLIALFNYQKILLIFFIDFLLTDFYNFIFDYLYFIKILLINIPTMCWFFYYCFKKLFLFFFSIVFFNLYIYNLILIILVLIIFFFSIIKYFLFKIYFNNFSFSYFFNYDFDIRLDEQNLYNFKGKIVNKLLSELAFCNINLNKHLPSHLDKYHKFFLKNNLFYRDVKFYYYENFDSYFKSFSIFDYESYIPSNPDYYFQEEIDLWKKTSYFFDNPIIWALYQYVYYEDLFTNSDLFIEEMPSWFPPAWIPTFMRYFREISHKPNLKLLYCLPMFNDKVYNMFAYLDTNYAFSDTLAFMKQESSFSFNSIDVIFLYDNYLNLTKDKLANDRIISIVLDYGVHYHTDDDNFYIWTLLFFAIPQEFFEIFMCYFPRYVYPSFFSKHLYFYYIKPEWFDYLPLDWFKFFRHHDLIHYWADEESKFQSYYLVGSGDRESWFYFLRDIVYFINSFFEEDITKVNMDEQIWYNYRNEENFVTTKNLLYYHFLDLKKDMQTFAYYQDFLHHQYLINSFNIEFRKLDWFYLFFKDCDIGMIYLTEYFYQQEFIAINFFINILLFFFLIFCLMSTDPTGLLFHLIIHDSVRLNDYFFLYTAPELMNVNEWKWWSIQIGYREFFRRFTRHRSIFEEHEADWKVFLDEDRSFTGRGFLITRLFLQEGVDAGFIRDFDVYRYSYEKIYLKSFRWHPRIYSDDTETIVNLYLDSSFTEKWLEKHEEKAFSCVGNETENDYYCLDEALTEEESADPDPFTKDAELEITLDKWPPRMTTTFEDFLIILLCAVLIVDLLSSVNNSGGEDVVLSVLGTFYIRYLIFLLTIRICFIIACWIGNRFLIMVEKFNSKTYFILKFYKKRLELLDSSKFRSNNLNQDEHFFFYFVDIDKSLEEWENLYTYKFKLLKQKDLKKLLTLYINERHSIIEYKMYYNFVFPTFNWIGSPLSGQTFNCFFDRFYEDDYLYYADYHSNQHYDWDLGWEVDLRIFRRLIFWFIDCWPKEFRYPWEKRPFKDLIASKNFVDYSHSLGDLKYLWRWNSVALPEHLDLFFSLLQPYFFDLYYVFKSSYFNRITLNYLYFLSRWYHKRSKYFFLENIHWNEYFTEDLYFWITVNRFNVFEYLYHAYEYYCGGFLYHFDHKIQMLQQFWGYDIVEFSYTFPMDLFFDYWYSCTLPTEKYIDDKILDEYIDDFFNF